MVIPATTARSSRRRFARVLTIATVVAVALAIAGAIYQSWSVRREASRFPPPGRMVDVGGRRLHLVCMGSGEPTVIFEPGAFGGALSSEAARLEVSRQTRVCSYDRLGMGWSDPGPDVVSFGALADDLARLLERADLGPPYVLVPVSMGGLTVELFARRHPDRVAGLVFSDAGESGLLERLAPQLTSTQMTEACLARVAARFGLLRLIDPLGIRRQQPREQAAQTIAALYRVEPMSTLCAVVRGIPSSVREFSQAPPLAADVPLTVLTAESISGMVPPLVHFDATGLEEQWRDAQQRFARRSSRGTWQLVAGSDHALAIRKPHVVATAVLDIVERTRRR